MRILNRTFLAFNIFLITLGLSAKAQDRLVDFVDPRIGASGDESNCAIEPQLPYGSINPGPQTPNANQNGYIQSAHPRLWAIARQWMGGESTARFLFPRRSAW